MSWVKIDCQTAARRRAAARGSPDDVPVDEMKGAPDLVEAGEQVRRIDTLRQRQPIREEVVIEIAPERPVARHPPPCALGVLMYLVQRVGVALVQCEDDERRVKAQFVDGRGRPAQQSLAGVARRPLGDHADPLQAGALRPRLRPQAPNRTGGSMIRDRESPVPRRRTPARTGCSRRAAPATRWRGVPRLGRAAWSDGARGAAPTRRRTAPRAGAGRSRPAPRPGNRCNRTATASARAGAARRRRASSRSP